MIKHPKPAYVLLFVILVLFSLVFLISYYYPPSPSEVVKEEKEVKDPGKLYPQELFFLDRNYPDYIVPPGLYQRRLGMSIQFDKSHAASRDFDHPWTVQGPGNIGGRINTIAVDPSNRDNILLGYSQGGMYQSRDGSETWTPVFDEHSTLSIGHISFDPHHAGRVYATTGDVNISGYPFLGSGIYRSDDSGSTWTYVALNGLGVLSKVLTDPIDPDIIYAGSMGFPSHKGIEKGFFRSVDGGESWEKTLTIDDSTGIIDIVTDPNQPGRIFASAWTRIRTNTYGTTKGPGSGLYRSDDYGENWTNIINGLPSDHHSRTSIEIANDGTLFISYIGTVQGGECDGYTESLKGIYRSHDAGMTWDTVRAFEENGLPCGLFGSFGWYFEVLKVNPQNANDLFLLGVEIFRSVDGGESWIEFAPPWWLYSVHADKHDLAFTGDEMYLATDGGAYRGYENGDPDEWEKMENIPSTQFYRTTYNPHLPDRYFGGAQDNGTTGGNEENFNEWPRIWGGDGFQPLFDPDEPSWIYALTQYGNIWFSQDSGFILEPLTDSIFGTSYWDMPFVMSPHNSKILFAATHVLFKINMDDTARYWKPISPDLTKGDTILGTRYPAITAIAQSALDSNRLYAGTQDGKLWTTPDGGENWIDLTEGTPGHFVTSITTSTVDPSGVFVTYSGYRDNDHTPYIYRSDDAGENWVAVGESIPLLGVNSFMILPGWNDAVLFAATDGGVYVSVNSGIQWERLGSNFPYMPVYDLEFNPVENTIVAATFSRGIMTFPVEELDLVSAVDDPQGDSFIEEIIIFPTLINDHFFVDMSMYNGPSDKFNLSVYSQSGHLIKSAMINLLQGKNFKVDLPTSVGLHIVEISDAKFRQSFKIIVQ